MEIGGNAEEFGDEAGLCDGVLLGYPPHSPLPDHLYRFDSLQSPPCRSARAVPFRQPRALLYRAVVLLHHIVEVFALTQTHPTGQNPFPFSRFHCGWEGWVLVHVDDSRHGIARRAQSLTEEAFGSGRIPLRGEQKLDCLTGRVHSAVQISIFPLDPYIGFIRTVALVSGLQMGSASLIELGCIDLHPTPNAARVNGHATFRQ